MPRCFQCKEMLPPDLCEPTGPGTHICIFCKNKVSYIKYGNEEMTKEYAINDYKKFLYELKENPNVKKLIEQGNEKGEKSPLTYN